MKRYCRSVLLIFIAFWSFSALAQNYKGPKIVFKEEIFDFKEVIEGSAAEHVFQVLNEGDEVLEIKQVKSI